MKFTYDSLSLKTPISFNSVKIDLFINVDINDNYKINNPKILWESMKIVYAKLCYVFIAQLTAGRSRT